MTSTSEGSRKEESRLFSQVDQEGQWAKPSIRGASIGAFIAELGTSSEAFVSIGSAWGPESGQIDQIMHRADDAMYERKRAYYRAHDRRRR